MSPWTSIDCIKVLELSFGHPQVAAAEAVEIDAVELEDVEFAGVELEAVEVKEWLRSSLLLTLLLLLLRDQNLPDRSHLRF
jgi:hypothetical protein